MSEQVLDADVSAEETTFCQCICTTTVVDRLCNRAYLSKYVIQSFEPDLSCDPQLLFEDEIIAPNSMTLIESADQYPTQYDDVKMQSMEIDEYEYEYLQFLLAYRPSTYGSDQCMYFVSLLVYFFLFFFLFVFARVILDTFCVMSFGANSVIMDAYSIDATFNMYEY